MYSQRINDPAYTNYIKKSGKFLTISLFGLTIVIFGGFMFYGLATDRLWLGLILGILLGGILLISTIVTLVRNRTGTTWDGTIEDKRVKRRWQLKHRPNRRFGRLKRYNVYILYVRDDNGKMHKDDSSFATGVYDYYQVGDRVRRHKGLQFYEKNDKSQDAVILCNACLLFNSPDTDICPRCKCPVLN